MWARIDNGFVAELIDFDPAGKFHSSIKWVECDSSVECGMTYNGIKFGPKPGPDLAALAASVRAERDRLLREVYDISVIRLKRAERSGVDVSIELSAMDEYANQLLAVPQQDGFPLEVDWPSIPGA